MEATIEIEGIQHNAKTNIRILGVQVDTKLKWGPHLQAVKSRYESQLLAFGRISKLIWGASFVKARLIYSLILRPTLSYAANV